MKNSIDPLFEIDSPVSFCGGGSDEESCEAPASYVRENNGVPDVGDIPYFSGRAASGVVPNAGDKAAHNVGKTIVTGATIGAGGSALMGGAVLEAAGLGTYGGVIAAAWNLAPSN